MSLRFVTYRGPQIADVIDDLAQLRIAVFRDWPYLYDGDLGYERRYLASSVGERAIVVGAFDGQQMVGAATGRPLSEHTDDFAAALSDTPIDFEATFYCAESVLLASHRGQGAYEHFFSLREQHARDAGFTSITFCSVIRRADHPARPNDDRPLDMVWRKRGYVPILGAVATFSWRDVGDAVETEKPMQFWMKRL